MVSGCFIIDSPLVKVFTDAHVRPTFRHQSTARAAATSCSIWAFATRCSITGAVYYNIVKRAFSDLHNLDFRAGFNSLLQKYSGKLSYEDGHLEPADSRRSLTISMRSLTHATTFHLTSAKLISETHSLS